jgi:hypothetical protein
VPKKDNKSKKGDESKEGNRANYAKEYRISGVEGNEMARESVLFLF